MRHVDVVYVDGEMVDVREIVDNLHDDEIYRQARDDLLHTDRAFSLLCRREIAGIRAGLIILGTAC